MLKFWPKASGVQFGTSGTGKVENDLGAPFVAAVRLILQTKGNVIFSGVGKSGHIGRKLAATFSSTGTTSFSCTRMRPPTAISA